MICHFNIYSGSYISILESMPHKSVLHRSKYAVLSLLSLDKIIIMIPYKLKYESSFKE